jgi:hypothetical protein
VHVLVVHVALAVRSTARYTKNLRAARLEYTTFGLLLSQKRKKGWYCAIAVQNTCSGTEQKDGGNGQREVR